MRPEPQQIIARIENITGHPVSVIPSPDLAVMATITTTPEATGSYVVQHRPGLSFKDYLVAFQCGHLLRILALPEPERRRFATNQVAVEWALKLVKDFKRHPGGQSLPDAVALDFAHQLTTGLFTQLRSIPIGMRVDAWLAAECPGLATQQEEALAAQQQEAVPSLSPQIRSMVPDQILSASILLNTAHALFCDRLLGTARFEVPYAAAGFTSLAEPLLRIFDEVPADPAGDRTLVDAWASEIGLDGKYTWIPFSPSDAIAS